jgi:hypothetical protein
MQSARTLRERQRTTPSRHWPSPLPMAAFRSYRSLRSRLARVSPISPSRQSPFAPYFRNAGSLAVVHEEAPSMLWGGLMTCRLACPQGSSAGLMPPRNPREPKTDLRACRRNPTPSPLPSGPCVMSFQERSQGIVQGPVATVPLILAIRRSRRASE